MFHIIFNPKSGTRKTLKVTEYIKTELEKAGNDVLLHPTEYKGHAKIITEEITSSNENTNIIVIGGDGTFSEVINGVKDFDKVTFGLIPCGTGNDFARKMNISSDCRKSLLAIVRGDVANLDYIQMPDKRCLNVAGAGMDVDVLVRYGKMRGHGKIKYYLSLIHTLIHLKFHNVRVTVGGEELNQKVFMVAVANGTYIGGGMPISPESSVSDGLLDVVVIHELKRRKVLGALLAFLSGNITKKPYTQVYRATEAIVEVLDEGKIQVDGEVMEGQVLDCKIIRNKLRLYL